MPSIGAKPMQTGYHKGGNRKIMAYEFLERLFGTPKAGEQPKALTFAELSAAIEADKKLKLADLSAGGYVDQHAFDAQKTELEGVKAQLAEANKTIKGYKDMKPEELQQAVANWEAKYTQDTKALNEQMAALRRSHAEDLLLSGYKFTSKAAKNGIAAELKAQNFQLTDAGELTGAKEWLKGLTKQEDYKGAFVSEEPPADPAPPTNLPRFAGPTNQPNPGDKQNPFGNMGFSYVNPPKQ